MATAERLTDSTRRTRGNSNDASPTQKTPAGWRSFRSKLPTEVGKHKPHAQSSLQGLSRTSPRRTSKGCCRRAMDASYAMACIDMRTARRNNC
ncbi:UNVERIFIED_CONTAM: hypothetical protein Sangu_2653900 [Sesamum angustifolium]|uniref:Uncharacterized protein n=1 Tax=Sesamum angustifolium TaxID=2727405 RepID=A0AAW2J364_9LAMI